MREQGLFEQPASLIVLTALEQDLGPQDDKRNLQSGQTTRTFEDAFEFVPGAFPGRPRAVALQQ